VQDIFCKVSGAYQSAFGAVLPNPTTVNFTSAQVSPGWTGSVSTTKNAARLYFLGAQSAWVGIIYGNTAKLTITSEWGSNAGLIEVSIDGGAFADAPNTGSIYTLFSGLPHAAHFVVARIDSAYADASYMATSGNVIEVTGQPPNIAPYSNWFQPRDGSSLSGYSVATAANSTANYVPAYIPVKNGTYGSGVCSVKIKGSFTSLAVLTDSDYVWVSKNGESPNKYATSIGSTFPRGCQISGLSGLATYYIWNDGGEFTYSTMSVSGDGPLVDCGIKSRLDQFGDSITDYALDGGRGDVETMRVAAAIGYVGSTNGTGGYTIANLDTQLTTLLTKRQVSASDVAILAIGRNNVTGSAFDGPTITAYQSCITKLLAAGYGKVLCRGILPSASGNFVWAPENGSIHSIVTGLANPNVIFVNTSSWYPFNSSDTVHPSMAGFVTLAGFAVPAYQVALGL
jgi:hypothetical protein